MEIKVQDAVSLWLVFIRSSTIKISMRYKSIALLGLLTLSSLGLLWAEEKSAKSGSVPPANEPASPEKIAKIDPAEIEKTTKQVKEELGKDYLVEYQEPFVVAGNLVERTFARIKDGTIKECSAALYKDFFKIKPDYPINVYLFKDAQSYNDYCKKTTGRKPSTPFGFYSHTGKKLIMDISTGTGTLVHEMVHALISPDFPDVPPWLNEGLGSLYEQCQIEDNGSLNGLINWRYPRLKKAISTNTLAKLKNLMEMNEDKFYGDNSDLHYAEARYFCMHLQELKILPKFYKTFRDNYYSKDIPKEEKDTSGIKTLTKLLDKSIDEIEKDWIKWAVKLEKEKE